ncbi:MULTISPECIES: TonB-dependent siderophore receptor [unclassified Paraburkholderia]|uniref:TonB-dependent siderophore receptor n=1 Tax=unclassified Paraburkholderia TaxID=2615204 RepID=UPI001820F660|nr:MULTISPECIES: TonB-dependent siderophore receptor [unclassified Paraburkholderia]MBB5448096.1 iron complex outermembrane receptor protein [Paraburkholderia sp. WSM4177]MBB5488542.1 iron complex outermembrane receptor protein [Paraburkholderia sp. WSM4180]
MVIGRTMVAMAVMALFSPALYAQADGGARENALAPQPGHAKLYAQQLVDRTVALHPELVELDLHMRPPGGAESVIVAAKSANRIGRKSDPDDLDVVRTGTPFVEVNKRADQNVEVHLPLLDVTRKVIGAVEVTFPYPTGSGLDKEALIRAGALIRDELSRQIRYGNELFDPVLPSTGIPDNPYAQTLVDEVIRKRRDVMVLAMHVARPGGDGDYPIIASNIGRIGKPADADDRRVIETGKPHVEVGREGDRLEVELPLQDAGGATIGALGVVMPYRVGDDQEVLVKKAEKIRDELRGRIRDAAALYEPRQLVPATSVIAARLDAEALGNKQSLPMTKEVMGAGALQTATEGVTDAVRNQAGVAPTNSSGSPADAASIRGIKVNLFANYRLNGGLPTANVMSVPAEDKQRVETLKGANALMFGVASPAGILNMVTKRAPMDNDVASVALLGNSFGQFGVAADVSHRFGSEKQVGLRVNASDTHLENGVHGANGRGWFGSVGADWQVTNRLHFQFDVETYRKDVVEQGSISLPTAVNGHITLPRVPDPRNLLSGPWAVFSAKTTNIQGRVDYDIAPGWKALVEIGQSDSDRSRSTTRIGGYNVFTGAGGIPTVSEVTQLYFNKYKRAELLGQFATGPLSHDITFGVSRSERIAETPRQNTIVLPVRVNIFDPIPLPTPVPTHPDTSLPKQVNADTGLYTYDMIGVGSKWKLLLGFRESRSSSNDGVVSSATWVGSPAFGILYDVLPTTTLFASYMKGIEDGGVAPANAKNAYQVLAPAVSTQYEFGVRDHYFRWLQFSASVFDITRANAVTNPATQIFANDGTIEYRGAEAVLTQEISRQWSLSEAVQYLHAVQNPEFDMTIKGRTPENTPKWIGNIALTHRPLWLPGLSLTVRASFITKRPVNPQNQGYIPGYTIYSLGASYATRIAGKHVDIRVAVDNLFNKRYWNSVQTGTLGTGMDRSVRMVAKIDF